MNTFYVPRTRQDMGDMGTDGNNRLLSEGSCQSKGRVRSRKSVGDPVRDAGSEHRGSPRRGGQVPVGWNQPETRLSEPGAHGHVCNGREVHSEKMLSQAGACNWNECTDYTGFFLSLFSVTQETSFQLHLYQVMVSGYVPCGEEGKGQAVCCCAKSSTFRVINQTCFLCFSHWPAWWTLTSI